MSSSSIPIKSVENDLQAKAEEELLEIHERSLTILTGIITVLAWLSSFRLWTSGEIRYSWLFLILLLTTGLILFTRSRLPKTAPWVLIFGVAAAVTVEMMIFPEMNLSIFYTIVIIIAGVLIGSTAALAFGFSTTLLVLIWNQQHFLPNIHLTLILLISTTILVWVSARQTQNSIYLAFYYAHQAREALEDARDRQGRLARAVKSLDESNARLVKAYEAVALAQNESDQARELKIRFANMISHEMRGPLNFIIGATDLMVKSPETYGSVTWPSNLYEDIRRIYQSCQHLSNLVEDVITLGQLEIQKMDLTFEETSILTLLQEAEMIFRPTIEQWDLQLNIITDPQLPLLALDRMRIRQVILNLLSNSYRHTRKGKIDVHARVENKFVIISVEDTGSGIASLDMANIFHEFSRSSGEEVAHSIPSSGLGLTISKQFIELHGGRIWAESPIQESHNGQGVGTRVSISLPIKSTSARKSLRVGHGKRMLNQRTVQFESSKSVVVYCQSPNLTMNQIPLLLSDFQLVFVQSAEDLLSVIEDVKPCGLIHLTSHEEQDSHLPEIPDFLPIIHCSIVSRALSVQELWDGYLVKPSPPEKINTLLKGLGLSPSTCLVIDDDPSVSRYIELSLLSGEKNCTVHYENNGESGLTRMYNEKPDVVFLDINLPGISGWEILQKIRLDRDLQDIPVIIFSGLDNPVPAEVKLISMKISRGKFFTSQEMNNTLQRIFDSISLGI